MKIYTLNNTNYFKNSDKTSIFWIQEGELTKQLGLLWFKYILSKMVVE